MLQLHGLDITPEEFACQKVLTAGRPVRTILDVGANIGNTVSMYREMFPDANIFCLEPYLPAYQTLVERFKNDLHVRPFNLAASSKNGASTLHLNKYSDTNSLLPRPSKALRYYAADNWPTGTTPVAVTTLDTFVQEQGLDRIDILKLDIQGGEEQALKGASKLLGESRIDIIFSEVFFVPHYEGAALFHEISTTLQHFDYSVFNLCHLTFAASGQLRFADAIYISPKIRKTVIDGSSGQD